MQLSPNTQAILLLTAPLLVGKGGGTEFPLAPREYKLLARRLRELQSQPSDLLGSNAMSLIEGLDPVIAAERIQRLLDRGFQLSQALERWSARAIWVLSRADSTYPKRLKARCKEDAPPVIYGCGDVKLLETAGLAVVGSRKVDDKNLRFTRQVASLVAKSGRSIVSGGARGVDQAAMGESLREGGGAIGVLADGLLRAALNRENREFLMDDRLILVSPFDPSAGFNVGNAMQRNKYIYALAEAALVVKSDFQKGGTWNGAKEQLQKFHYVPVYVGEEESKGMEALRRMGARKWPNPEDPSALGQVFSRDNGLQQESVTDEELPLFNQEELKPVLAKTEPEIEPRFEGEPERSRVGGGNADALFSKVREILQEIDQPMTEAEIAEDLGVTLPQARVWLNRMIAEGLLRKTKRPVRYLKPQTTPDLFFSSDKAP